MKKVFGEFEGLFGFSCLGLLGYFGWCFCFVFKNISVNLEAAKFLLCKTSGKSIVFMWQGFMWPLGFWTVLCCKLLK